VGPLRQRLGRESSVPIREERGDGRGPLLCPGRNAAPRPFCKILFYFPFYFPFSFLFSLLFLLDNFKFNFKTTFELVKLFPLFGELQGDFLK
jgi:hypothetical protein